MGFLAMLKIFMLLFVFMPPAHGFDFVKKPRYLSELCRECLPNYSMVLKNLQLASGLEKEWQDSLVLKVPDQATTFKDLPLIKIDSPTTMTIALRQCGNMAGSIVEFYSLEEFNTLKKITKNAGFTTFVGHMTLDSTTRPEWGGSSLPYTIPPNNILLGMTNLMQKKEYDSAVRWNLASKMEGKTLGLFFPTSVFQLCNQYITMIKCVHIRYRVFA